MAFPSPFYRWRPHPWHGLESGSNLPSLVNAYIEITPFDMVKYELDEKTGYLHVDRPQRSSALPPTLYGFIPRTYCGRRVSALMPNAIKGDSDPLDDRGHGTHVSGTIAAEDNTEGVIGVAPEAKIYAVKVLDKGGSGYYSDIIAGIQWAVTGPDGVEGTGDEAQIISMSLGGGSDSQALHDALDEAYGKGVVVVASAGNGGDGDPYDEDPWNYPAAYSSVIAVGATNDIDDLAEFSTSASYLELSAPGVSIYSTMPTYDVTLTSTGPPPFRYSKNYDYMSGTSMACPHVSGTVALILYSPVDSSYDTDGDSQWDPGEVRQKLIDTAEDLGSIGWDKGYGYGLANAEAVTNADPSVNWIFAWGYPDNVRLDPGARARSIDLRGRVT